MQKTLTNDEKYEIVYEELSTNDITFKGGMIDHIHQWFRLTPSFSPKLIHYMKKITNTKKEHKVLEPFLGASTTVVECMKEGIDSVGIDINPVFVAVGKAAIEWNINTVELKKIRNNLHNQYIKDCTGVDAMKLDEFCLKFEVQVPPIHKPEKWWREDVIKRLLILKKRIYEMKDEKIRHFFYVGLLCKVVDVASVNRLHPTLTFCDRSKDKIDVEKEVFSHFDMMIQDLTSAQKISSPGKTQILEGDSTKINELPLMFKKFDRVFTSPPYPNRYSYVWETRPQLYFGDIFDKPSQAADLDIKTIGGTWGKATSNLAKGKIEPLNKELQKIMAEVDNELRPKDVLMANYVMKFFNLLYLQIKEMKEHLNDGAMCCYVVGNSRIKDVEVYTDILLADLFVSLGYTIPKIVRIRKRIGRRKLYEAIVIAKK